MAKEEFDKDGFSLSPVSLHEDAWFYADKRGLTLVHIQQGTLQGIIGQVHIPWSKLKQPIETHQKLVRKRARAKKRGA